MAKWCRGPIGSGAKMRGTVHKKCVIWLTIKPAHHGADASQKYVFDLRRQLADTAVIHTLLVRDSGVS
jgi:hypothetical protein